MEETLVQPSQLLQLSEEQALFATVRRRLRKQVRFWAYALILIVGFPVIAYGLWMVLNEHPWLWASSCVVLLLLFACVFAAAVYYVLPAVEPAMVAEYLSLIFAHDPKGLRRVQEACLQTPESIVNTLFKDRPTILPIINPVDAAFHLLRARSQGASELKLLEGSAVHIIPPGRSEAFYWNTDRAKEYFQLQRTLMAQGTLRLRRLILTAKSWPLPLNEINVWFAQVNMGAEVRWLHADNTTPLPKHALDFLILEQVTASNVKGASDVLAELPQSDGIAARILLFPRDEHHQSAFEEFQAWFEMHWSQARLFEIPTSRWWVDANTLARVAGESASEHAVLAYYNATRIIKGSKQYIRAVDVSDLKESLAAVYDDPTYTAWYEATLSKCREGVPLERVFVLRRSPQSIDEFTKRHLPSYFDAQGGRLPGASVAVVFEDDLKNGILTYPVERLEEWLQSHPLIREHLQRVGPAMDNPRQCIEAIVARDFLLTERMLYDYRSGTARFDFEKLEDYLLFPEESSEEAAIHWASLIAEWSDIVEFLKTLGAARTGASRDELAHVLQQAKASLMVHSGALEILSRVDTLKLNRHRIVGNYFRHGAGHIFDLREFVTRIRNTLIGRKPEAFLIWGASGSGKTFLVEEVIKSQGEDIDAVFANLAKDSREDLEKKLNATKAGKKPIICFIDEIDSKPLDEWPYDVIFSFLSASSTAPCSVIYVMAGSLPGGLPAMTAAMSKRFKGPDLINRIGTNVMAIEQFSIGDRLVLAIVGLRAAAESCGRRITAVEKRALLYILGSETLSSGHQLRQFCQRVIARMNSTEEYVRFAHLFDASELEQRDKWIAGLAGHSERLKDLFVDIED